MGGDRREQKISPLVNVELPRLVQSTVGPVLEHVSSQLDTLNLQQSNTVLAANKMMGDIKQALLPLRHEQNLGGEQLLRGDRRQTQQQDTIDSLRTDQFAQQETIDSLRTEHVSQRQNLINVSSSVRDGFHQADQIFREHQSVVQQAFSPPILAGQDSRRLSQPGRLRAATMDSLSMTMPGLSRVSLLDELQAETNGSMNYNTGDSTQNGNQPSPPPIPPSFTGLPVNAAQSDCNRHPSMKLVAPPAFNPLRYAAWKRDVSYWRDLYQYVPEDQIISSIGLNANDQLRRVVILVTKATRLQLETRTLRNLFETFSKLFSVNL